MHYNTRKEEKRQKVRNRHKGIEYVCQIPDEVKAHHSTEIGCYEEYDSVGIDCMADELVFLAHLVSPNPIILKKPGCKTPASAIAFSKVLQLTARSAVGHNLP